MKDAGLFQQEEFDTRYKDKIRRAEGWEDMGQGYRVYHDLYYFGVQMFSC